jgi:ketosteroid isomerase-like protein
VTRDQTLDFLKRYLRAVEEGGGADRAEEFYTADALLIEHPNKLAPKGVTRDLTAIIEAGKRGQAMLDRQTNELESAVIEGDRAALTLRWTGVFKIDVPQLGLKAGDALRARFAQFYTLRDGRIARQETFDCFEG